MYCEARISVMNHDMSLLKGFFFVIVLFCRESDF